MPVFQVPAVVVTMPRPVATAWLVDNMTQQSKRIAKNLRLKYAHLKKCKPNVKYIYCVTVIKWINSSYLAGVICIKCYMIRESGWMKNGMLGWLQLRLPYLFSDNVVLA